MRRYLLGLAVAFGFTAFASAVHAQVQAPQTGLGDPFFFYYGVYLPRQAALAAQPTTPSQINDIATARQSYAMSDRAGLYDPISSPFSNEGTDPLSPFGGRQKREPLPHLPMTHANPRAVNGLAPVPYYNKTARYHPTIRSGSGPNRNVIGHSARRGIPSGPSGYGIGF